MINQFKTFGELSDTAAAYLKSLSYSSSSVDSYTREWRYLNHYMKAHKIQHYNASVGVQYLADKVGDVERKALPRNQRNRIRAISVLSDFAETGTIRKRKKKQEPRQLDGPIGKVMTEYIVQAKYASGLASSTVQSYHLYLSVLLGYVLPHFTLFFAIYSTIIQSLFMNGKGYYPSLPKKQKNRR